MRIHLLLPCTGSAAMLLAGRARATRHAEPNEKREPNSTDHERMAVE